MKKLKIPRSFFFEKINKFHIPLARLINQIKIASYQYEKKNSYKPYTHLKQISYYKTFCNIFYNVDEMNKLLEE